MKFLNNHIFIYSVETHELYLGSNDKCRSYYLGYQLGLNNKSMIDYLRTHWLINDMLEYLKKVNNVNKIIKKELSIKELKSLSNHKTSDVYFNRKDLIKLLRGEI